jgi:penicillin-binding protein 1A
VRGGNGASPNGGGSHTVTPPPPRNKPKLKKLRLALILVGLAALALVSTVFGMLMAVSSDLPSLENKAEYKRAENSILYSSGPGCRQPGNDACQIAKLTGNKNRILVREGEVSPNIKNAVIAIEDQRFYEHQGVDYSGIGRALIQDVLKRRAAQGGSTITQQFVKNALSAQADRTVFQKLREAALAYHLERQWPKEKILTQYLNTVYFGNGAYGIEAAVRTYFGNGDEPDEVADAENTSGVQYTPPAVPDDDETDPNARESEDVTPYQAAMLAGLIASPSLYDPVENPRNATARRNLVLSRMYDQGMITRAEYKDGLRHLVPDEDDVDPPTTESKQPYFTSWMTQQLVDRYRAGRVFSGGLKIKTTIDPEIQAAAESAMSGRLAGVGPDASMAVIENKTGEVKAMVGGSSFNTRPFNLATNGHRQPGSSFKPFTLIRALDDGIDPNSVWSSQPKDLPFQGKKGPELFKVRNYEDSYLGSASLWSATAASDNSVFAELGMKVKPKRVARMANRMGIRTKLSTNPAMILGGLEEGVTPLEMAYAYSTIANDGVKVSGSLAPNETGPVAFTKVEGNGFTDKNRVRRTRVYPAAVGQLAKDMLSTVVTSGTGKAAQVGDEFIWGKTGTTENYGDAWFAGGNEDLSVAIWVGYADRLQPMETEHGGAPVAGGTFPAEIFHDFMTSWLTMRAEREANRKQPDDEGTSTIPAAPVTPSEIPPAEQAAPTDGAPAEPDSGDGGGATPAPQTPQQPPEQAPAPNPAPAPAPAPTTPPSTGGGTGGGVGAAPP